MKRRTLIVGLVPLLGGLAGCNSLSTEHSPSATPIPVPTDTDTTTQSPQTGYTLPITESELVQAAPRDGIPAIVEPQFAANWDGLEIDLGGESPYRPRLEPDAEIIGVVRDGAARAYPLKVLNWHEVVNDEFNGPLLVTFCPLCQSGITAERFVKDVETVFGVSGFLWKGDLVLYDRSTESLWSQILATAISGPQTGNLLTLVPSTLTTWRVWREAHPETDVLLPPPFSGTVVGEFAANYDFNLYENLGELEAHLDEDDSFSDTRLPKRALVLGITIGEQARAYPQIVLDGASPVNDELGGQSIVVAAARDGTLVAFDRRVDDDELTFSAERRTVMRGGGSRWDITSGMALDGPYKNMQLTPIATAARMYWFAWLDFHPNTDVYGRDVEPA